MYNSSELSEEWSPLVAVRVAVLSIFLLIILVGICGNVLVLLLVICVKSMQTIVNLSLAMLSVADLLVLTLLPVLPISHELTDHATHVGKQMCAFLNTYDRGAVLFSVLIYIFVTLNKYIAVCHPIRSFVQESKSTFIVGMLVIITVTTATSVPYSYIYFYCEAVVQNETIYHCFMPFDEPWEVIYETVMSIVRCFLPVPFLFVLHWLMIKKIQRDKPGENCQPQNGFRRKGKRQTVIVLMVVVCLFVIGNWPMTIVILLSIHSPETLRNIPSFSYYALVWTVRILLYINSASNPVVYFAISTNFRKAFMVLFCMRHQTVQLANRRERLPTDSTSARSLSNTSTRPMEQLELADDHM